MSSFSLQNSQLRAALAAAGLPDAHAANIANILGNAAQEMRHAGTLIHDTTPEGMRLVESDARKQVLTGIDFLPQDPDYRKPQTRPSEDRPPPEQPTNVFVNAPPQLDDADFCAAFNVAGGAYTTVNAAGQAARIDLNMRVDGPCVFVDPATNTLRGKGIRAESGGRDDGRVRFWIENRNREAVWRLQLINVKRQDVVTGVQYQPGRGLVVTYQTIDAWSIGDPYRKLVPLPLPQSSIMQPIVIGKRSDDTGSAGWDKGSTASVQPYVGDTPSGEAPIDDVMNRWRYIKADQFVAIAQDENGDWYVVESEVGCLASSDMHAYDISKSSATETSTTDAISEGGTEAPQVLLNHEGCTKWVRLKMVSVPAVPTNNVESITAPVRTNDANGLTIQTRNVYVFDTGEGIDDDVTCDQLGPVIGAGAFTCDYGTGTISITGEPCSPTIDIDLTLDTTECPPPEPPPTGGE